jgi:inosose dehydratase
MLNRRVRPIPGLKVSRGRSVHRLALSPACWGISDVEGWGPQLGVERVLTEAEAIGEGAITAGPLTFLPNKSVETRALLKRHRLRVVAGQVHAVLHHNAAGSLELAHIDGHADWLAAIGADTLVLSAIPQRDTRAATKHALSTTDWARLLHVIGSVEHLCSRHRLKLAVQPRFGSIIQDPEDIERLLVGSEAGICFDLGQLVLAGADPVDVLSLAVGRINHVQLNDVDLKLAGQVRDRSVGYADAVGRDLFKPLGEGGAQVSVIVEMLRRAGYGGWYTLEQETRLGSSDERPLGRIGRSLEFLLPLLG